MSSLPRAQDAPSPSSMHYFGVTTCSGPTKHTPKHTVPHFPGLAHSCTSINSPTAQQVLQLAGLRPACLPWCQEETYENDHTLWNAERLQLQTYRKLCKGLFQHGLKLLWKGWDSTTALRWQVSNTKLHSEDTRASFTLQRHWDRWGNPLDWPGCQGSPSPGDRSPPIRSHLQGHKTEKIARTGPQHLETDCYLFLAIVTATIALLMYPLCSFMAVLFVCFC